jgi:GLPGLI family protein
MYVRIYLSARTLKAWKNELNLIETTRTNFMRIVFVILLAITKLVAGKAQVTETAFASVRYSFTHIQDTTDGSAVNTENMVLYLGKNTSYYQNFDKIKKEADAMAGFEAGVRAGRAAGGTIPVDMTGRRFIPTTSLHKNIATAKLTNVEVTLGKEYTYEEKLPLQDWKISTETKQIKGLSCQKAVATFRGRTYEAWFCNDLPYNNGPWKLGGLPGLIVEAYDLKKEVVFQFESFENISDQPIAIGLAKDAIATTAKELDQLKNALNKNPSAINQGKSSQVTAEMSGKSSQISGKKKEINNPIEKKESR